MKRGRAEKGKAKRGATPARRPGQPERGRRQPERGRSDRARAEAPRWVLPDGVALGLVLLAALVMHGAAVRVPFFADDYLFLDQVRNHSLLDVLSQRDPIGNFFRPFGRQLYFWTLSRLSGESPMVFHGLNLILFLGVLALLFVLVRRHAGPLAAAMAAGFLAVHYAVDVPVRWASGSQDLLAIVLALATLVIYGTRWRPLSGLTLLLALLSKETVLLTPVVALLADRPPGTPWRAVLRRAWPLALALAVWAALWIATAPMRAKVQSSLTLDPWGPIAALAHLVQVTLGLEWTKGQFTKNLGVMPPWLAVVPLLIAAYAARLRVAVKPREAATEAQTQGQAHGQAQGHGQAQRQGQAQSRAHARVPVRVEPRVSGWLIGGALALAGTVPVAAVVAYWSSYYYLYALCGVAFLIGMAAARLPRPVTMVGLLALAWGSAGGRALPEFSTGQGIWTVQSRVNRFYFERATTRVARYLADMKRQRPTLPKGSVIFFAGLPSFVAWQAGDGPLVRWAYRDSSLRSYYMGALTLERARRGPRFFFICQNDSMKENLSPDESLRMTALAMILSEKFEAAHDALVLHRELKPAELWSAYWLGWVKWAMGDSLAGKALLDSSGVRLSRGPAPEVSVADQLLDRGDSTVATNVLIALAGRYTLDPYVHARLSELALRQLRQRTTGQIEAFVTRTLAPNDPLSWLLWAIVEGQQMRFPEAVSALERYFALGGTDLKRDFYARQMQQQLKRALPGGDLAQEGLRKSGVRGKR